MRWATCPECLWEKLQWDEDGIISYSYRIYFDDKRDSLGILMIIACPFKICATYCSW